MTRRNDLVGHRGRTARRRRLIAGLAIAVVTLLAPASAGVAVEFALDVETVTPTVEDTTPITEVDTTVVETTVPEIEQPPPAADEGEQRGDADAVTWLTVGAALILLAIAVWWMARRGPDADDQQRMDHDWPGGSEVI